MLTHKQQDLYIEIRQKELKAGSEDVKNRYIASLELFLNELLPHFEEEETDSNASDVFLNEYFGLMHNSALEMIEKLEKQNEVAKESLYYIRLKNTNPTNSNHCYLWLNQSTKEVFFETKTLKWTNYGNIKNTFTDKEIDAISEGAFVDNKAFELLPVEEDAE